MALLLALASALVPALSPTGAATPGRMLGSAFDPTNDVKTLRVRQLSAVVTAASALPEAKRAPVAGFEPVALPAFVRELAVAGQAHPALLPSLAHTEPGARPRTHSPAQPRAPPVQSA